MADSVTPTVSDLTTAWDRDYPLAGQIVLDFPGCPLAVRSNSAPLLDALRAYCEGFILPGDTEPVLTVSAYQGDSHVDGTGFVLHPPGPGKRPKESFLDREDGRIVLKVRTKMVMAFGAVNALAGDCAAHDNQVVNFINNRYIEHRLRLGDHLFHAAAFFHKGRGTALCGFAGAGKSSLALYLMNRGAHFVSNDRLMVHGGLSGSPSERACLQMTGVLKHPRINPGTILSVPGLAGVMAPAERERYSAMSQGDLWHIEDKYDGLIHRIYGPGRFDLEAPLSRLVILNWRRDGGPMKIEAVDLAQRADLYPAFMKTPGVFYQRGGNRDFSDPFRYVDLLKDCEVLEISGGIDFEGAADFLNS